MRRDSISPLVYMALHILAVAFMITGLAIDDNALVRDGIVVDLTVGVGVVVLLWGQR